LLAHLLDDFARVDVVFVDGLLATRQDLEVMLHLLVRRLYLREALQKNNPHVNKKKTIQGKRACRLTAALSRTRSPKASSISCHSDDLLLHAFG